MGAESVAGQDLADGAFVMLDPAVEILDLAGWPEVDRLPAGTPELLRGAPADFSLLCQTDLEMGMVVPPGEGILELVKSLMGSPVGMGALRGEYDDRELINGMLSSLLACGFAHVTSREMPSTEQLAELRAAASRRLARRRRRVVAVDLDATGSLDHVCEIWSAGETAPEVILRCSRLSDHEALIGELARRRHTGALRAHHVVVRASDIRCTDPAREALFRLGAAVEVDGVAWPEPERPVPGLVELARRLVSAHAIVRPDASLLDKRVRARTIGWMREAFVTGLCLRLDPRALWDGAVTDEQIASVLDAVRALEVALGDVLVMDMPSDEALGGRSEAAPRPADLPDAARRLRLAYLRWRIPIVKAFEWKQLWPQVPEVEDKWVRSSDDLLPNHAELLQLGPAGSVVDVCGGLGRVARRLAPAVGRDGIVISIEMHRIRTERARRFACEQNLTNLQFRPGLAERLPLPDGSVDAAVNEWTGPIWVLGLGPVMVGEMARVVRPGGRIAVTHRLVQLRLGALDEPWVQYKNIYRWVRAAFEHPELTIVSERVWGQTVPPVGGENVARWMEQYIPRLVVPDGATFGPDDPDPGATIADVFLTIVAERRRS